MEKCKEIGIHLTHSDYYGASEDSRGITDIYCNIELPQKTVHSINASVVGLDDKIESCLKCSNLDESIKKDLFCKNPYDHNNFIKESNYQCIYLKCKYRNYINSNKKQSENGELFYRQRDANRATHEQFIVDICNGCFLNPKKYEKK